MLDYIYSEQASQYAYYRIPKILFTDDRYRDISTDAKVLYGLLLDRVSLSIKNKWVDDQNRVFIIFSLADHGEAVFAALSVEWIARYNPAHLAGC